MWVYGRASTFQSQIAGFDLATGLWIACNLQSNTIVIILEQINFHEYPQISNLTLFFRHWGSNSPVFINFILWNSRSTYMWSFKNVCRVYPGGSQSQPSSPQYASPDSWKTSPQQLQTEPQPIRYHPDRQNFGVFFSGFSTEPFHRRDVLAQRCASFFFAVTTKDHTKDQVLEVGFVKPKMWKQINSSCLLNLQQNW